MGFSYDTSLSEPKDVVRLNLGDTEESTCYLSNEEIEAVLRSWNDNTDSATVELAHSLAARFARQISVQNRNVGLYEDNHKRAEFFARIAKRFEDKIARGGGTGGAITLLTTASNMSGATDSGPAFSRDLHKVDS